MIALVVLMAVGLSLAYTYALKPAPTYEARTEVLISGAASNQRDIWGVGEYAARRTQAYVELVMGDELARRVVRRFDLSETPGELASQVSASAVPDSVVLEIVVTNPSADRAQFLANAVTKEFGTVVRELETPVGKTQPIVEAIVIDRAEKPASTAGGPQTLRNVAVGLVLGFLAGFGLAVIRESIATEGSSAD